MTVVSKKIRVFIISLNLFMNEDNYKAILESFAVLLGVFLVFLW